MLEDHLKNVLVKVKKQQIEIEDALKEIKFLPFSDLEFAKVDHHREIRQGFPEAILCLGKTPAQVKKIVSTLTKTKSVVLATKATKEIYLEVKKIAPSALYNPEAKTILIKPQKTRPLKGLVVVLSAGTSDIPIAEEAAITAEALGGRVEKIYDVGVAGIHRLFAHKDKFMKAKVIIVVAGMEGALASIVGGLVSCPVIAVPTSIGYGANFGGISALLSMLNSCSANVVVVNIDNGFGAGYVAGLINRNISPNESG
ncbi:MAG: nickel pincer cofactor biosynthesis protein LarB [Actinobacteria bacterium]|nr:nickel pincer cofactor biosynthesis protein LarB [Actinomycetota bacterium]